MALPKLVVFDVDGTLVSFQGHCSDAVRSALRELRDAGVVTAIATGRPRHAIRETLEVIGPVDYAVCGNGSTVTDLATNRTIRETVVPSDWIREAVPWLRRTVPGVGVAIEFDQHVVEEEGFHSRLPPRRPVPTVDDALVASGNPPPDAQRVIFFHDEYDHDLPGLAKLVRPSLDHRVDLFHAAVLPIVEVIPAGDNKAVALTDLAVHLGMVAADVAAFGDGVNDIEMLEWAGLSVAMAGARESVRAAADHVVPSVDEDGVPLFVEMLLSQEGHR